MVKKLNDSQVLEIRDWQGKARSEEVGAMYGVHQTTINRIWRGSSRVDAVAVVGGGRIPTRYPKSTKAKARKRYRELGMVMGAQKQVAEEMGLPYPTVSYFLKDLSPYKGSRPRRNGEENGHTPQPHNEPGVWPAEPKPISPNHYELTLPLVFPDPRPNRFIRAFRILVGRE